MGLYCNWLIPLPFCTYVVGVVEQIERLRLKFQFLAFPDFKTACQSNVDPLQPGTIKRI